jgi:hypothetical protein
MPSELMLVKPVALPAQSAVATVYESTNLADAFAIQLPFGTSKESLINSPSPARHMHAQEHHG